MTDKDIKGIIQIGEKVNFSKVSHSIEYDLVIVGAGVAGSMVAYRAIKVDPNLRVLLMDAGPELDRAELVEKFRGSHRDDSMSPYPKSMLVPQADPVAQPDYIKATGHPYDIAYVRAVGGTTWHWGGISWRFAQKDFKLFSQYGVGRDWPIGYADMENWYQIAEEEMGVAGKVVPMLNQPRSKKYPLPAVPFSYMDTVLQSKLASIGLNYIQEPNARNTKMYDTRPQCCASNNCIPICPVGAQYCGDVHAQKAKNIGVTLLANAVVYQLEQQTVNGSEHVTSARYKTPDGGDFRVKGKKFVIASNAIETAKLMLMSTSEKFPNGIANSSGLVGRNLMDHPTISARFQLEEPVYLGRGPVGIGAVVDYLDGDFRRQLAAKKMSFGNGQFAPFVAKELIDKGLYGKELDEQVAYISNRKVGSYTMHEQLPDVNNRVTLSKTRFDAMGLPMPDVHWQISDYEQKSADETKKIYGDIAKAIGSADYHVIFDMASDAHAMGTTIMGDNPQDSVVNAHCCCHDVDNLYIAGSAVFPSGAAVNPTLTIAALSCRLAEHLTGGASNECVG